MTLLAKSIDASQANNNDQKERESVMYDLGVDCDKEVADAIREQREIHMKARAKAAKKNLLEEDYRKWFLDSGMKVGSNEELLSYLQERVESAWPRPKGKTTTTKIFTAKRISLATLYFVLQAMQRIWHKKTALKASKNDPNRKEGKKAKPEKYNWYMKGDGALRIWKERHHKEETAPTEYVRNLMRYNLNENGKIPIEKKDEYIHILENEVNHLCYKVAVDELEVDSVFQAWAKRFMLNEANAKKELTEWLAAMHRTESLRTASEVMIDFEFNEIKIREISRQRTADDKVREKKGLMAVKSGQDPEMCDWDGNCRVFKDYSRRTSCSKAHTINITKYWETVLKHASALGKLKEASRSRSKGNSNNRQGGYNKNKRGGGGGYSGGGYRGKSRAGKW